MQPHPQEVVFLSFQSKWQNPQNDLFFKGEGKKEDDKRMAIMNLYLYTQTQISNGASDFLHVVPT